MSEQSQEQTKSTKVDELVERVATAVASAVVGANAQDRAAQVKKTKPITNYANPNGLAVRPKFVAKEVFFCGVRQKARQVTNSEILLFNQITEAGDYGPDGAWRVRRQRMGGPDEYRLFIDIPCKTLDQRMALPRSLSEILNVIIAQQAERSTKPAA